MFRKVSFFILLLMVSLTAYLLTAVDHVIFDYTDSGTKSKFKSSPIFFQYLPLLDTIHLLGDSFIMLNLDKQLATVITRKDTLSFNVSTGTDRIEKGKNTPTGLFTVQSKSPIAISKQFDNAELYHWIGFNGNIGFHGLKGNKYYWSLGIRPSSHGCVRVAREDGEKAYKRVRTGTPVFVYNGEPARILAFSDTSDYIPGTDYLLINDKQSKILAKNRLNNIYKGSALRLNNFRVFFDGKTIIRVEPFEIGDKNKIPRFQKPPILFSSNQEKPDNTLKIPFNLVTLNSDTNKTKQNN